MKPLIALAVFLFAFPALEAQQTKSILSQTFTSAQAGASSSIGSSLITSHRVSWIPVGTVNSCTIAVDSSTDGNTWVAGGIIGNQNCTTPGMSASSSTIIANFMRMNVTVLAGGGSVVATYEGVGGTLVSANNFPTAVTLTGRNLAGGGIVEKGSRWSVVSEPAAGTAASAVIPAEAGVKHVADCITLSADATGSVSPQTMSASLKDGSTVIWTVIAGISSSGNGSTVMRPWGMCGLNLVGSTNTDLTLTWDQSVANVSTSAVLTGYYIN